MSFLPEGYEIPTKDTGYLKLLEGDTKFRILSDAIVGHEAWADKAEGGREVKRKKDINDLGDQKYESRPFWAFIVWNYGPERVQILSVNQKTIMHAMQALDRSKDWGDIKDYDITINRVGSTKDDTKYTVTPSPKKKFEHDVKEIVKDVNLNALYENDDPFVKADKEDGESLGDFEDFVGTVT